MRLVILVKGVRHIRAKSDDKENELIWINLIKRQVTKL